MNLGMVDNKKTMKQKMLNTPLQFHVMSKDVHPQRLHNICTKDLATDAIQEALLHVRSLGEKHVTEFVKERLLIEDGKVAVPFKTVPNQTNLKHLKACMTFQKTKHKMIGRLSGKQIGM